MRFPFRSMITALSIAALPVVSLPTQAKYAEAPAKASRVEPIDFVTPVLGPFAYTHFCLRYRRECRVQGRAFRRPRPVVLTRTRLEELSRINREVNRAIAPRHYVDDKTFDTWRIAPKAGDCNDYAVTKRHELLARGWPSHTLLLSEVVTPWGEHHLILVVRTDRGNLVLDNLNPGIRHWSRTPYSWVRMQLPDQPSLWATIKDPRPSAVS